MFDKENRNRGFYDFVLNQVQRCPWVSKTTESEWLKKATYDQGVDPFEASSLILGATSAGKVFVETEVDRILDDLVASFAGRRGRLSYPAFRQLTMAVKHMARGGLDQKEAEQLVKDAVLRQQLKPAGRGPLVSKRWYRVAGSKEVKS